MDERVTRFTRVWIETRGQVALDDLRRVTRFTRVWIETLRYMRAAAVL